MIKEFVERKINATSEIVVEEIANYFGHKYRDNIINESKNVKISLLDNEGVYTYDNGSIYIGEEPVCIKEKSGAHIILPLPMMCSKTGNVSFVHAWIHALSDDCFVKDGKDAFDEVVVDFIAEDIAKNLENKKINITINKDPLYFSSSFYSRMFGKIEKFYRGNKDDVLACKMGEKIKIDRIDEYIDGIQQVVDDVFVNGEEQEMIKKNR